MQVEESSVMMQSGRKSLLAKVSHVWNPQPLSLHFSGFLTRQACPEESIWHQISISWGMLYFGLVLWLWMQKIVKQGLVFLLTYCSKYALSWIISGIMCEEPIGIQHGFSDAEGGNVPCGSKVTYGCYWWADMKGNSVLACTTNGTFDHLVPQCGINCTYLQFWRSSTQSLRSFIRQLCILKAEIRLFAALTPFGIDIHFVFRLSNYNNSHHWGSSSCHDPGILWQEVSRLSNPDNNIPWTSSSHNKNSEQKVFSFSTICRNLKLTRSKEIKKL